MIGESSAVVMAWSGDEKMSEVMGVGMGSSSAVADKDNRFGVFLPEPTALSLVRPKTF